MALSVRTGTLNTGVGAVGTTIPITGLGFQPKVVFLFMGGRVGTTDATARLDHKRAVGCFVSTTSRWTVYSQSDDTPTKMATDAAQRNDACMGVLTIAGAIDGLLDVSAIGADGFTLVVDDVFTADYRVHYLALGGTDITDVLLGSITKPVATGTQDTTTVGFQPNFLLFAGCMATNVVGTAKVDSSMFVGAASSSSEQAIWAGGSNDAAVTSATIGYANDLECIAHINAAVTDLESLATLSAFLSNGFRLNWLEAINTASQQFFYCAIKGGSYKVAGAVTSTVLNATIVSAALAGQPRGGMVLSKMSGENISSGTSAGDNFSCGAFDSLTSRRVAATLDGDAAATALVSVSDRTDAVYANVTGAGVVDGLMDVSAIGASTVTFIMDDPTPFVDFFWYVLFGDAVVAVPANVSLASLSQSQTLSAIVASGAAARALASLTQQNNLGAITPTGSAEQALVSHSQAQTQNPVQAGVSVSQAVASHSQSQQLGAVVASGAAERALASQSQSQSLGVITPQAAALLAIASHIQTNTLSNVSASGAATRSITSHSQAQTLSAISVAAAVERVLTSFSQANTLSVITPSGAALVSLLSQSQSQQLGTLIASGAAAHLLSSHSQAQQLGLITPSGAAVRVLLSFSQAQVLGVLVLSAGAVLVIVSHTQTQVLGVITATGSSNIPANVSLTSFSQAQALASIIASGAADVLLASLSQAQSLGVLEASASVLYALTSFSQPNILSAVIASTMSGPRPGILDGTRISYIDDQDAARVASLLLVSRSSSVLQAAIQRIAGFSTSTRSSWLDD